MVMCRQFRVRVIKGHLSSFGAQDLNQRKVNSNYLWANSDLNYMDFFFPKRWLEEEHLTLILSKDVLESMEDNLAPALHNLVALLRREHESTLAFASDKSTINCLTSFKTFLDEAIKDVLDNYHECKVHADAILNRQEVALAREEERYGAGFRKAIHVLKGCSGLQSVTDSQKLQRCTVAARTQYLTTLNATVAYISSKPTMKIFKKEILTCIENAAVQMNEQGFQFLKNLKQCQSFDTNSLMTITNGQWDGYNCTLTKQVEEAALTAIQDVAYVERIMIEAYKNRRMFLDTARKGLLDAFNNDTYRLKVTSLLGPYTESVESTLQESTVPLECSNEAVGRIKEIIDKYNNVLRQCKERSIENIFKHYNNIRLKFMKINKDLPHNGNVAILSCFLNGYIFAPDAISRCFQVSLSSSRTSYKKILQDINVKVEFLKKYQTRIYDAYCEERFKSAMFDEASLVLFNLQKCLYMSNGEVYDVTTRLNTIQSEDVHTPLSIIEPEDVSTPLNTIKSEDFTTTTEPDFAN